MVEQEETPKIMTKPLPTILDEMEENIKAAMDAATRAEAAAADAEKHSEESKTYADRARDEAQEAVAREFNYIKPQIERAQSAADNALKLGGDAASAVNQALGHIEKLYELIKETREWVKDLGMSIVNGFNGCGKYVVKKCSKFLEFKDETKD